MNNVLAKKYLPKLVLEEFVEECKIFVEEYSCPLCEGILFNSVIDRCGHSFCKECIEILLKDTKYCLFSNKEILDFSMNIVVNNVIEKQRVYCKNRTKCEWIGKLSERFNHLSTDCNGETSTCEFLCGIELAKEDMKIHLINCEMRVINCAHCDEYVKFVNLEDHYKLCINVPVLCSCGVSIPNSKMKIHIDNYCELTITDCPFQIFGCCFYELRRDLKNHLNEDVEDHMKLISNKIKAMEDIININKKEIISLKNENDQLRLEIGFSNENFNLYRTEIKNIMNNLNNKIDRIKEYQIIPFSNYSPIFNLSDNNIITITNNHIVKVSDNYGWFGISSQPLSLINDKTIINFKIVNTVSSCIMMGLTFSEKSIPLEKGFYHQTELENESLMLYCYNLSTYIRGRSNDQENSSCIENDIIGIIINKNQNEVNFYKNGTIISTNIIDLTREIRIAIDLCDYNDQILII